MKSDNAAEWERQSRSKSSMINKNIYEKENVDHKRGMMWWTNASLRLENRMKSDIVTAE